MYVRVRVNHKAKYIGQVMLVEVYLSLFCYLLQLNKWDHTSKADNLTISRVFDILNKPTVDWSRVFELVVVNVYVVIYSQPTLYDNAGNFCFS